VKSERKRAIERLDNLYSEYIRKRAIYRVHACERCLHWKKDWVELQTAHCFTRHNLSSRLDIRNSAGLCGACHMYIDSHEDAKMELFRRLIGSEDLQRLFVLSHLTSKQSPVDFKMTEIYLKTLIKRLDGVVATTS